MDEVTLSIDKTESIVKGKNGSVGFQRKVTGLEITLYGKRGAVKGTRIITFDAFVGVVNQRLFYELDYVIPSCHMKGFCTERYSDYAQPENSSIKPLPQYDEVRLNDDSTQSIVHSVHDKGSIGFMRYSDGIMVIIYNNWGTFKSTVTIGFDNLIDVVEQRLIYELDQLESDRMVGFTTQRYMKQSTSNIKEGE